MVVRGAPAIGVTGALSLAVDLTINKNQGNSFSSVPEALSYIFQTLDYLVTRCDVHSCQCHVPDFAKALYVVTHIAACSLAPSALLNLHRIKSTANLHQSLSCSRPTAVNLADSALKLKAVATEASAKQGSTAVSVVEAVVAAAESFLEADIAANRVSPC
jgi:methylthioribose-1-phosphate isomerase